MRALRRRRLNPAFFALPFTFHSRPTHTPSTPHSPPITLHSHSMTPLDTLPTTYPGSFSQPMPLSSHSVHTLFVWLRTSRSLQRTLVGRWSLRRALFTPVHTLSAIHTMPPFSHPFHALFQVEDIEFSPEDAGRSDPAFLIELCQAVIEARGEAARERKTHTENNTA